MLSIHDMSGFLSNLANTQLSNIAQKAAAQTTNDITADVRARVQHKGLNEKDTRFSAYSDNILPVYFFEGKSRTGSDAAYAKVKDLAKRKKHPGFASYKDWRTVNNLQVERKDFTFTGRLFNSIKITGIKSLKNLIEVIVEPGTKTEIDKLKWTSDKEGVNVIGWSRKELAKARKRFTELLYEGLKDFAQ